MGIILVAAAIGGALSSDPLPKELLEPITVRYGVVYELARASCPKFVNLQPGRVLKLDEDGVMSFGKAAGLEAHETMLLILYCRQYGDGEIDALNEGGR